MTTQAQIKEKNKLEKYKKIVEKHIKSGNRDHNNNPSNNNNSIIILSGITIKALSGTMEY